jgi:hypothetical protein
LGSLYLNPPQSLTHHIQNETFWQEIQEISRSTSTDTGQVLPNFVL